MISKSLFRVKVYVEDRESSGVCIGLTLKPSMTIEQLKNKVCSFMSFRLNRNRSGLSDVISVERRTRTKEKL